MTLMYFLRRKAPRRHSPRHRRLLSERLESRSLLAADIRGQVWNDLNQNGLHDSGEPGLAATLVELVSTTDTNIGNSDDQIVATLATDAAGNYVFSAVNPAQYYLRFMRQPVNGLGHRFTTANVGSNDSIDSDVISSAARSEIFNQLSTSPTVIDAGLIQEPSNVAFAFRLGGVTTQQGKTVIADPQGNIYVGLRSDSVNIDLDPGPAVVKAPSEGGTDLLVAKYSAAGQFVWVRSFGGTSVDLIECLALDAQGNVYLTGVVNGNAYFGPGPGQTTLPGTAERAFVAKLDPAGNVLWARQSLLFTSGLDISVDAAGSAYVAGAIGGQFPNSDPFVWKLDTNGNEQWYEQTTGAKSGSWAEGIYATATTTYVTGSFQGTADFDPSAGVANLTSSGGQDVFLWQLDSATGAYTRAFRIGGPSQDLGSALTMSPDGNVLITGRYSGTVDFDPSPAVANLTTTGSAAFVLKLDATGNLIWARAPQGTSSAGLDVAVTASGQVWSTGSFNNSADFDPSPTSQLVLNNNGGNDFYLWGLDGSGNFITAYGAGSSGFDLANGVALTIAGDRLYIAGNLDGAADFDPGPGTLIHSTIQSLTPTSQMDAFLWAINNPSPPSSACSVVVTNTLDSGAGSLREAINCANNTPNIDRTGDGAADPDVISFAIPGSGVKTITLATALPVLAEAVIIDGYTQPGASPNTNAIDDFDPAKRGFNGTLLIELSGRSTVLNGLSVPNVAAGSTIRGLVVNQFIGSAILLGSRSVVEGCFIGTDATGTLDRGNLGSGIAASGSNSRIGGTSPASRNVVSNNWYWGIELADFGSGASGNVVQGNFVGTDVSGTKALGNRQIGVRLYQVGGDTVGGTQAGARNIIAGNGVGIDLHSSTGNTIQGNYIGVDVTGARALGNSGAGIVLDIGGITQIGGTTAAARNVISGNGAGIVVAGSENIIQGNFIGTDFTGAQPLGNADFGIHISRGEFDNVVGGTVAGAGNVIAFNGGDAVSIQESYRHSVLGNSIYSNGGLGIDIEPDGPNANDPGDADNGANYQQNYPELSAVTRSGATLSLSYVVPSLTTNSAYPLRVEFFKADSSGQEGKVYLGSDSYAAADANTNKTFSFIPASTIAAGDKLVATATDSRGNTSEFGNSATAVTVNNDAPIITSLAIPTATVSTLNHPSTQNNEGGAIATDGAYLVVGAPHTNFAVGVVYLYNSSTKALLRTLTNPTQRAGDYFGYSVAISGTTIVVGSVNSGAAYVFDATTGNLLRTLYNPTPGLNDQFGLSVAISDNTIVIGDIYDDTGADNAGAAYVYNASTGDLLRTIDNPAPKVSDWFGWSVAVLGTTVVISASNANSLGTVYVFDVVTGALLHILKKPSSVISDSFGQAVALSSTMIVVGAPYDHVLGVNVAGEAHIFGVASGNLLRTLRNPMPTNGELFGDSLAVSGTTIVVGAPGRSVYSGRAYVVDSTSGALLRTLDNPLPGDYDRFGTAVAITGNTFIVGADGDDTAATNAGSVYVFSDLAARNENDNYTLNGTFHDADVLDTHSIAISWGGGPGQPAEGTTVITTAGPNPPGAAITAQGNGDWKFSASHKYLDDNPTGTQADDYTVKVIVTDNKGGTGARTTTATVNNIAPVAIVNNISSPRLEGKLISIPGSATDVGTLDTLTFGWQVFKNGAATPFATGGNVVTYSFTPDNNGSYRVALSVTDDDGGTSTSSQTIDVSNVAPVSSNLAVTLNEDNNVDVTLLAIDVPADPLSYTIVSAPKHGTLSGTGPSRRYKPETNFNGIDTFTYLAGDGLLLSNISTVSITVMPVNDAPLAVGDSFVTSEDTTLAVSADSILANDTDVDAGDTKVVTAINGKAALLGNRITLDSGALVTVHADGSFEYDPNGKFESLAVGQAATDSFTYTVADGQGAVASSIVTITIQGANDPPVITSNGGGATASISVNENTQLIVADVSATDPDDTATLSYSITGGADAAAFAIDSATGVLRFVAAPDFENPTDADDDNIYNVTMQVSDGQFSDSQALAVTVTDVSDICSTAVVNTEDRGPGSLRDAILCANDRQGVDTISFNIPGTGVRTITPATPLPTITDPVIIDGYSQPGASVNTQMIDNPDPANRGLNGQLLIEISGAAAGGSGLVLATSNSIVRGLVINGFALDGIVIDGGDNNVIAGNYIGVDPTGTIARPNGHNGVFLFNGASGNIVGTNGDNDGDTAERNLISGNLFGGVAISGAGSDDNRVAGNLIGTTAAGTAALGNVARGVNVFNGAQFNRIGTDANGVADAAERNVISGNGGQGVQITGAGTSHNVVAGNYIGVDATGSAALGNAVHGVWLWGGATQNTIGGTATAAANTIAFNTGNGVIVSDGATIGNAIAGNSIFSNTNLGIDLGGNGVTANDSDDADSGPNQLQNFPVITAATLDGSRLTIRFRVPSETVNSTYPLRVEFFQADANGQEGQTLLGVAMYSAADFAAGEKTITLSPAVAVTLDSKIVATATDGQGNTSEFSASAVVLAPVVNVDLQVTILSTSSPVALGGNLSYSITVTNAGPEPAANVQLADALPAATAFASASQTAGPAFVLAEPSALQDTFTASASSLPAGESASFVLIVRVNSDVASGTAITNTATVTTTSTDVIPDNNLTAVTVRAGTSLECLPLHVGTNTCLIRGAIPGGIVGLVIGTRAGSAVLAPYPVAVGISDPRLVAQSVVQPDGTAAMQFTITAGTPLESVLLQGFELAPRVQTTNIIGLRTGVGRLPEGSPAVGAFTAAGQFQQNPASALDANGDGAIAPSDALVIINFLNMGRQVWLIASVSDAAAEGGPFLDVDGDSFVSPADALAVINYLNRGPATAATGGEGEPSGGWFALDTTLGSQTQPVLSPPPLPYIPAEEPAACAEPRHKVRTSDASDGNGSARERADAVAQDADDETWNAVLDSIAGHIAAARLSPAYQEHSRPAKAP